MRTRLLCLLLVWNLFPQPGQSQSPLDSPREVVLPAEIGFIAPADIQRHLVEHLDTQIIDVRTEEERQTRGYILNSLHIDHFHGQQTLDALSKLISSLARARCSVCFVKARFEDVLEPKTLGERSERASHLHAKIVRFGQAWTRNEREGTIADLEV